MMFQGFAFFLAALYWALTAFYAAYIAFEWSNALRPPARRAEAIDLTRT